MLTATTNVLTELARDGYADLVPAQQRQVWALGYTDAEVLAFLNTKAAIIRQGWMSATEKQRRFANWVAIRLAA